jgi:hypothetical protein
VWVGIEVSPDGRRLLVNVAQTERPVEDASGGPIRRRPLETWAYDVVVGDWQQLDAWPDREIDGFDYRTVWAGPETIARTGPGVLALESLSRPGDLRFVIGSASD